MSKFFESRLYVLLIGILCNLTWASQGKFSEFHDYGFFSQLIILALILIFSNNLSSAIPLLLSLSYSYNVKNPNLNTISSFGTPHMIGILLFLSILIHIIRFKPKMKMGRLGIGYLLIAIAYILPLLYVNITPTLLQLSVMGFVYLFLYIFLNSTVKITYDYLMRVLFIFSLVLLFELLLYMYLGWSTQNIDLTLKERFLLGMKTGWYGSDLGWANINDVGIQIILLFPSQFYFIAKHRYNIFYWLIPAITGIVILISASRGTYISYALSLMFLVPLILSKTKLFGFINMFIVLLIILLILIKNNVILEITFDLFKQGGFTNLNEFSSYRFTLYENALKIFRMYPIFGGGWEASNDIFTEGRIQVFHSTLFHTLAVMGTFGIFSLLAYLKQLLRFFINNRHFEKNLIGIGFLVTQIHGLVDNTMYMLVYMVVSIVILVSLENTYTRSIRPKCLLRRHKNHLYRI